MRVGAGEHIALRHEVPLGQPCVEHAIDHDIRDGLVIWVDARAGCGEYQAGPVDSNQPRNCQPRVDCVANQAISEGQGVSIDAQNRCRLCGLFCALTAFAVSRRLTIANLVKPGAHLPLNLGAHSGVQLDFDLYLIRSWDGSSAGTAYDYGNDAFKVSVGGGPVLLDKTFSNGNPAGQTFGPAALNPAFTGAAETYSLGYVFVDGSGVGEIGPDVMREREILAQDGFVLINLTMDRNTCRLLQEPEIITRGFVHTSDAEDLLDATRKVVVQAVDCTSNGRMQSDLEQTLKSFLYSKTKRRPMVFVTLSKA